VTPENQATGHSSHPHKSSQATGHSNDPHKSLQVPSNWTTATANRALSGAERHTQAAPARLRRIR